jgi:hypothetical protein
MACVFGEMRTLKTGSRWWSPKCTADRFPGIAARRRNASSVLATTAGECLSYQLCRVRPISCNESRSPLHSPSCDDPCTRCLSQPTTSSRSHTISLYSLAHCLALSRSHAESRSLSHQLPHGTWYHPLSTSHTVSLYPECIRLTVCRATGQPSVQRTDTEPRTVRHTTERTGNIHCCMLRCCCSNCCCAHTVLPTTAALLLHHTAHRPSHRPLLHYYCTIQHTTRHTNLCCTMQPLLHRPLLHRPLLP